MYPKSVFQKTEKGRDEISKRTHRLDARKRTVLILVDGQSDAESLATKVDNAAELLDSLAADGFVQLVSGGDPPAAAPAPRASPQPGPPGASAAPSPTFLPLDALKRAAASQIDRLMGPEGEALALKLEAAPTREAFHAEARKVHQALVTFLGERKAAEFARALGL